MLLALLLSLSFVSAHDVNMSDVALENDYGKIVELYDDGVNLDDDKLESLNSSIISSNSKDGSAVDSKHVNQVPHKVKTKNIKSTYGTPAKYKLKLFDKSGKIIVGKKVAFKVKGKFYKVRTDSDGVATLKLNFAAGKYTIKYWVGDLKGKNTYTVYNKVTFTILKWGNKGDVSKVKLLKKNMPNNKWVKKAVKATKNGNPLLKFQGGKGKVVFITAGVHGNELSSQVAAMKLIKYLSKNPIKGTVYVIPFVNIKAISHKVRHTGVDYNRVAHKSGTLSNNIVKLVDKLDCDAYGDFHTTQPGGVPGKNIVMGSKTPAKKSASLTKYIAKHAKVNKRIYKYAGEQYPGALADNVNKKGIPAVICEVVLPHNTVTSKSVKTSYEMMKALLKYNSVI
ncbi:succinylglutamate desuccinylase/aspartoacylase family protein [Methanobrevibacter sp.]